MIISGNLKEMRRAVTTDLVTVAWSISIIDDNLEKLNLLLFLVVDVPITSICY